MVFSLRYSSETPRLISFHLAPRMLKHLLDIVSLRDVAVEHAANEVNALVANRVWYPQIVIHYLVDAIKRVLLVNDGIE